MHVFSGLRRVYSLYGTAADRKELGSGSQIIIKCRQVYLEHTDRWTMYAFPQHEYQQGLPINQDSRTSGMLSKIIRTNGSVIAAELQFDFSDRRCNGNLQWLTLFAYRHMQMQSHVADSHNREHVASDGLLSRYKDNLRFRH